MTVEEYRKKLMDIFHDTEHDEYIALLVEPTEKGFALLKGILSDNADYETKYKGIEDMPCVTEEEMQKCKDIIKKYTPNETKAKRCYLLDVIVKCPVSTSMKTESTHYVQSTIIIVKQETA